MATILLKKGKEIFFSRKPTIEEARALGDRLSTDSQRIHAAILAASFLSKESWIEMCYDQLGLCHDPDICTVKLKKIDEFFKNEAIDFLDEECAESCILGGEKPSEIISILLKYNF